MTLLIDRGIRTVCVFTTLLALGLPGCRHFVAQKFTTKATYDAPASGFRIVIDAGGVIAAGADATDNGVWKAVVTPLGSTNAKVVTMQSVTNSSATYSIDAQPPVTVAWGSLSSKPSFRQILTAAGYASLSDAEVAEAASAVDGAAGGPKITMLPGQTKSLTEVQVKF